MFCVFIQLDAAVVFALRRFGFQRFKGFKIKATVGRLNLFFLRLCPYVFNLLLGKLCHPSLI